MRDLEQTLAQLAESFAVRNIMVPKESVVCGHDRDSAHAMLEEHPNLDVIPIQIDGELTSYLMRGSKKPKDIRIQDMIGARSQYPRARRGPQQQPGPEPRLLLCAGRESACGLRTLLGPEQ